MSDVLERFRGALIVSCQVNRDEQVYHIRHRNRYLFRLHFVLAMAKSAELGGARGLRVENPLYIRRVREFVDLPVIGLVKRRYPGSDVYITPTLRDAVRVAEAGADVVAVDATHRPRPRGGSLETIVRELKRRYDVLLLADVSTLEEGVMAERMGFDMVATTLAGYTPYSRRTPGPDLVNP